MAQPNDDGQVLLDAQRTFPFTVASAIRRYRIASHDQRQQYDLILQAAENLIVMSATIALSWCRMHALAPEGVQTWCRRVDQGGLILGIWLGAARDGAIAARNAGVDTLGLGDAFDPPRGSARLVTALNKIVDARNVKAHSGAPSAKEVSERIQTIEPLLAAALRALTPVLDQVLVVTIEQSEKRRGADAARSVARIAMGDNPEFEALELTTPEPLPIHAAFLIQEGHLPLDLTPFLVADECDTCGRSELFHAHKLAGKNLLMQSPLTTHKVREAGLAHTLEAFVAQSVPPEEVEPQAAPNVREAAEPPGQDHQVPEGGSDEDAAESFWRTYFERISQDRSNWTARRTPDAANWLALAAGLKNARIEVALRKGHVRHALRAGDYYDAISARRDAFERAYGRPLQFEAGSERRAPWIGERLDVDWQRPVAHAGVVDWLVDAGDRMRSAVTALQAGADWSQVEEELETARLDRDPMSLAEIFSLKSLAEVPQEISVDRIKAIATKGGLEHAFVEILSAATSLGLYLRPYKWSVMCTPPENKGRMLVFVRPHVTRSPYLEMTYRSELLADRMELDEQEVRAALGPPRREIRTLEEAQEFRAGVRRLLDRPASAG